MQIQCCPFENGSSVSKIFFPTEGISNIESITNGNGITATLQTNGTYTIKTTKTYNSSRYISVDIDVTNYNYIVVGFGTNRGYISSSIDGATAIYTDCIDVSTLTGVHTLKLMPSRGQGSGGTYVFNFIIGF